MTDPMLNKSDANNKAFLKKLEPVLWLFTPVKSDGTPVKSMPEYTKKCLVIIIDECVEVNEEFIRDFHTNTFIPAIKEVGGSELKDYVVPYIVDGQFYRQVTKWTALLSAKAALMMYSKAFCGPWWISCRRARAMFTLFGTKAKCPPTSRRCTNSKVNAFLLKMSPVRPEPKVNHLTTHCKG